MPKLKLTYFDFHGGRAEPARLALSLGGVAFEDHRIGGADWPGLKPGTPFGGLPVLEVDGVALSQSNAINRYVGRLSGLYPEDPLQAAFCDEAMDAVESLYAELAPSMKEKDPAERKRLREELVEGKLAFYLRALEARLVARGGEWLAAGRLTVADLKVAGLVRHLTSGVLDHVPTDLVDRLAPGLAALARRVREHPGVTAYYARFGL